MLLVEAHLSSTLLSPSFPSVYRREFYSLKGINFPDVMNMIQKKRKKRRGHSLIKNFHFLLNFSPEKRTTYIREGAADD
jgi:hypothetical protein